MNDVILKMKDISKRFSGVQALRSAALEVRRGEIHALMGENGAGKSTLIKVLCGIHRPDGGSIEYFGEKVSFANIDRAQKAGISVIHQELNMAKDLTAAQNIFLGREIITNGFIDDTQMSRSTGEIFKRMGVKIEPDTPVGALTVGKQQMVEIAKAISRDCRLLVLDEPTAALTEPEVEELFKIMKELAQRGIGMIYVSHRMEEITRISDRITIMRDGEYIGTLESAKTTKDEIVHMMVGRVIYGEQKTQSFLPKDAPITLEVKDLCAGNAVKDVSFTLRRGEILGFAGLMGAGRTEVARAIYGADKKESGEIYINGEYTEINHPRDAVRKGICYLSEDRKRYGLMLDKSVCDNTVIASVEQFSTLGCINDTRAVTEAKNKNALLRTKAPSVYAAVRELSGGNQQKVIVARWLIRDADIFIFDEPTRGIDIGAKSEMYSLMENLCAEGKSIIMISSELPEILRLCDRIIVMCEGKITAELDCAEATQELIMKYATMREE